MSFPNFVAIAAVVVLGVVLALVSLFEASWQVLLLFLLLVIAFTEWVLADHRKESKSVNPANSTLEKSAPTVHNSGATVQDSPEASKTLTYRGAPYKSPESQAQEAASKEVSGKYRGGIWRSFTRF